MAPPGGAEALLSSGRSHAHTVISHGSSLLGGLGGGRSGDGALGCLGVVQHDAQQMVRQLIVLGHGAHRHNEQTSLLLEDLHVADGAHHGVVLDIIGGGHRLDVHASFSLLLPLVRLDGLGAITEVELRLRGGRIVVVLHDSKDLH